jgi:hypothetical protein
MSLVKTLFQLGENEKVTFVLSQMNMTLLLTNDGLCGCLSSWWNQLALELRPLRKKIKTINQSEKTYSSDFYASACKSTQSRLPARSW